MFALHHHHCYERLSSFHNIARTFEPRCSYAPSLAPRPAYRGVQRDRCTIQDVLDVWMSDSELDINHFVLSKAANKDRDRREGLGAPKSYRTSIYSQAYGE
jgi:hypothetical protein